MQFKMVEKLIHDNDIKFIDLRFCDLIGREYHISIPATRFNQELIDNGQPFDGSSIVGWQGIECSDMLIKPDLNTIKLDPFFEHNTLFIYCDVIDPTSASTYSKCPRSIAKQAELFLKNTGIADYAYFGPEAEFFIFDSVTWDVNHKGSFVKIEAEEALWSRKKNIDGGNLGHGVSLKDGYLITTPADSLHDLRANICLILEELGIPVEIHHHEVATAGQCEIGTRFNTLTTRADWSQIFKYVVKNTAHKFGRTATFMPKPILGDNGSGMHVHQSLWKNKTNLFAGNKYAGLSEMALYYIGGIIKHARALNAITNPITNSYKRLVPGFEAPVSLAYSAKNRSAAIRIPHTFNEQSRRIEVRFPDASANPYLCFSAMLMAGIDGIKNRIHPGEALDKNLYELDIKTLSLIPKVSATLSDALNSLDKDREFLTQESVFTNSFIDTYITLKEKELNQHKMTPTPLEFSMYYSV